MKDDRIFPFTRFIGAIVALVLGLAFVILFFFPNQTGELFAWAITPQMSSRYFGAAYLGGAWIQANVAFDKRWHRVQVGFPVVTVFTIFMFIATILHWERFSLGTLPFNAWLMTYIISPFLIPAIWFYNKRTDSGQPEESDVVVSPTARLITRLIGIMVLVFVAMGFLYPDFFIRIWSWKLTALTARVMAGWLSSIGVGALLLASDSRWSAWRVLLEAIFIGHSLVLVAAGINPSDFTTSVFNWFTLSVAVGLLVIAVYYVIMERRRRKTGKGYKAEAKTTS